MESQRHSGAAGFSTHSVLSAYWKHAESQYPSKRVGLVYIDTDTDLTSPMDLTATGTFTVMTMAHLIGLKWHVAQF